MAEPRKPHGFGRKLFLSSDDDDGVDSPSPKKESHAQLSSP